MIGDKFPGQSRFEMMHGERTVSAGSKGNVIVWHLPICFFLSDSSCKSYFLNEINGADAPFNSFGLIRTVSHLQD